jgi:hypothetical protein
MEIKQAVGGWNSSKVCGDKVRCRGGGTHQRSAEIKHAVGGRTHHRPMEINQAIWGGTHEKASTKPSRLCRQNICIKGERK